MNTKTKTTPAIDVARYILELGMAEDEPLYFTHMQLQKLLYYTQGWCLALKNRPLFKDRIEAWAHGPVVPAVYKVFASHGHLPITEIDKSSGRIPAEDRDVVDSVWETYKHYSGFHLREMTHKEPPWRNARAGLHPTAASKKEITVDVMKTFFDELAAR